MRIIKIVLKVLVMIAVFTLLVMVLWNWLIPDIFKGPSITYVQAFGLLLFSKILFSSFSRGFGRGGWRWRRHHWKEFEEKMKNMSEEERAKFKEKCGYSC
jgi:hypothetical protein